MSTDELFVAHSGDPGRPPCVLVHGSMDRSAGMLRLSRRLDDRYCVTRYDRRGYGRSVDATGPHTMASHVDDLEAICLRSIRVGSDGDRVRLFGHSFGGNIALALAERRPDLVHSVALYETPLSWMSWWPGNTAGAVAALEQDPADSAEAFMRRLAGDHIWERLPGSTRAARRAEGTAMVAEMRDLRRTAPWRGTAITVPVLAMHGELGRDHHRQGTRAITEMITGSELVEIRSAGHGAPNSHATDLASVLAAFWSEST